MFPRGLRAQLVISFAAVILLCLALAGSAFAYLLQPYQTQQALNRLATLAVPLAVQVRILEVQGATPNEIGAFLDEQADELNVRLLLLKQDTSSVLYDTGDTLADRVLTFQGTRPNDYFSPVMQGTADIPGEGTMAIVSVSAPPTFSGLDRARRRVTPELPHSYSVAVAAPTSSLVAEWIQVARRLGLAGLISLVASVGVAMILARSISEPLAAITRASEAMARGDYNQRIPARGSDEIARLASTFNVMAEQVAKSNRTLRAFLADVSHELRTPLTSVEGFAEAILDGTAADPEAIQEAARIINEDATRMERMVEDLLDLSKIESGQVQMDMQIVNLEEIVGDAVRRARSRLDGREIEVESLDGSQFIEADARRIDQVLDNLLMNAINHTPPGGQISVLTRARNGEAEVRVHNTGSFIRAEDRDRIFQRFFRGSVDGNGTGLGLAIASEITHSHHGRIDLETSETDGTAFTVALPLAKAPNGTVPSASTPQ